jgi:hypothetical protein
MGRAAAGWDAVGVDDTADVADPTEEPEWLTSGGIGGAGCAASTGLTLAFGGPAAATSTVSLRPSPWRSGASVWRSSTTRLAALTTNTEATVEFVPFLSSSGWAEPAVADGLAATAGLRILPLDL